MDFGLRLGRRGRVRDGKASENGPPQKAGPTKARSGQDKREFSRENTGASTLPSSGQALKVDATRVGSELIY
jgi:hypothetical protein